MIITVKTARGKVPVMVGWMEVLEGVGLLTLIAVGMWLVFCFG